MPRGRDHSAEYMAELLSKALENLPGFILKRDIQNGFADGTDDQSKAAFFGLLVRQYGSKPEYLWNHSQSPQDSVCFGQLQAVAGSMRISDTHPAVILGITNYADTDEPALHELARLIAPSVDAVFRTWRMRQHQRGEFLESPPPWLVLFGLVITSDTMLIVAHYPAASTVDPSMNLCSCVLDKIPYHPDICWQKPFFDQDPFEELPEAWQGPVNESDLWIRERLRLFIALQTILKNARRVAAIWDDISWSAEYFALEDSLEKRHAEWDAPTPSPSDGDPDPDYNLFGFNKYQMMIWEERLEEILVDEPIDPEAERERAEKNREKVLAWRETIEL